MRYPCTAPHNLAESDAKHPDGEGCLALFREARPLIRELRPLERWSRPPYEGSRPPYALDNERPGEKGGLGLFREACTSFKGVAAPHKGVTNSTPYDSDAERPGGKGGLGLFREACTACKGVATPHNGVATPYKGVATYYKGVATSNKGSRPSYDSDAERPGGEGGLGLFREACTSYKGVATHHNGDATPYKAVATSYKRVATCYKGSRPPYDSDAKRPGGEGGLCLFREADDRERRLPEPLRLLRG